ncbi:MAG: metal ABC transporter ATP-binding protein [Candidatus Dormibacteria bacterium]
MTQADDGSAVGAGLALQLRGAAVRVGTREVWQGVNLEVADGNFAAILGPNGSGKSTLLRALLGFIPLTRGSIEVFGKAVGRGNADIGYLPQRRNFDPDLRIRARDLVRLGLDGTRWGAPLPRPFRRRPGPGSKDRDAVNEVIELVGASAYAGRPLGELSGGEQQRILIAQALVARPRMLVLDEPLDSLDLHNQQAVAGLVQRVCRERGVTVLLVAHDINPILPYVDQVIYLARGGLLAGAPEDVISTETLSRLYQSPVEVLRTADGRVVVVGHNEAISFHGHEH